MTYTLETLLFFQQSPSNTSATALVVDMQRNEHPIWWIDMGEHVRMVFALFSISIFVRFFRHVNYCLSAYSPESCNRPPHIEPREKKNTSI